jgi:hypothetical protein
MMIKKSILIVISFTMALLLNQCSPGDGEKESDKVITGLTTKAARQKEAAEQSMAKARFETYIVDSINDGAAASIVVFDNQSGDDVLIKLIRSDDETLWLPVHVAAQTKSSVNLVEGRYQIKIRYGTPGNYRYIREDPFEATGGAQTAFTLHKIHTGENDSPNAIRADEF